jgi:hypothetical protein
VHSFSTWPEQTIAVSSKVTISRPGRSRRAGPEVPGPVSDGRTPAVEPVAIENRTEIADEIITVLEGDAPLRSRL